MNKQSKSLLIVVGIILSALFCPIAIIAVLLIGAISLQG